MEIIYPREWQIAIPESLMRVDHVFEVKHNIFMCLRGPCSLEDVHLDQNNFLFIGNNLNS